MKLYRLDNNNVKVDISPIGASIVNFFVADREGKEVNIVLGHDNEKSYENNGSYFGAVVGPIANRVEMGLFTIDGKEYQLTQNDGTNSLHGGEAGLDGKLWKIVSETESEIILSTKTLEGEGGYPCDIAFSVTYSLNDNGELKISYVATPDKRTPLNVTQHAYFNLSQEDDVLGHHLRIDADNFLSINNKLLPDSIDDVSDTPFDFREPTLIGDAIKGEHSQVDVAGGFDHCFVLNHKGFSMEAYGEKTGIRLRAKTDLPGVQLYTGNSLEGVIGRNGDVYKRNAGFCLETQYFPNQVNMNNAEECIFCPDNPFLSTTVYLASID